MLIPTTEAKPKNVSEGLLGQTMPLAIILSEEFGVSFTFYDAETGDPIGGTNAGDPRKTACRCRPAEVQQLAAHRVQVTADVKDGYRLMLPLGGPDVPGLLAVGFMTGFARSKVEEVQELDRLRKWAQSVCDRINLTTALPVQHRKGPVQEGSPALAWEALVTLEQLTRRLRIHKDSSKHQKRILRSAAELLRVKAVIWVPEQSDGSVLVVGESSLSLFDLRQLANRLYKSPELEKSGVILVNDLTETSWGGCFPQIKNLVALVMRDHGVCGLLIALNKCQAASVPAALVHKNGQQVGVPRGGDLAHAPAPTAEVPLRRADALALTSFAALFGLHTGAALRYHDLKELLVGMTRSLTSAIDAKDTYTFGHSERVGRIAVELGRSLDLSDDELNDLYLGGLMHDIGKIGIRDAVLCKRAPLTAEETEHLRQHVTIGHAIVADLQPIRHLFPAILYHHERYDGGGYPEGLKGDAIPTIARILAVADAYDAMTTTRPYRTAMTHDRAAEILGEGAGSQWDRQVIDAFFRCREKVFIIRQRGVGESLRQAIDGALRGEGSSRLRPICALEAAP